MTKVGVCAIDKSTTLESNKSLVFFKQMSRVGRASSGKCNLRVRMRVVSRIKYYRNISPPHDFTWFLLL